MNTLEPLSKALQANEEEELTELIGEIINPVEEKRLAVIPEEIFVEYFLDYFRDPNKDLSSPILQKWYELAQGPYNEVTVIDNNGNPLYVVPSVYPKIELSEDMNKISFSGIATEYNLQSARLKSAGDAVLDNALKDIDKNLNIHVEENRRAWAEIFMRYDKQQPNGGNAQQQTQQVNNVIDDNINDFLQY